MKGVRLVESRQPLKLASGVRFAHPLPLAAGAIGGAPRSERGGSRFEAWAASQSFTRASSKGQDGTLRTYKSGFDSSCPYQFSAGRPIAQDTALRTLKLGLESPLVDQSSRCRPTGEALDCRSRGCGFDSRTPRQVFRGCRLTAGSLVLTQRMRVQLSPALPWGCRLIGQDRCLSSSGCGIVTRRPYQVSGYKLCRRSTRLLIERAQFDSVMAHQVVPR